MLEKDLQTQIIAIAHLYGWKVHHTRTIQIAGGGWVSPGQDRGFPDLVMAKDGRIVFAELKTARGKLSPFQKDWLNALHGEACEVYVWRPNDLADVHHVLGPTLSNVRRIK